MTHDTGEEDCGGYEHDGYDCDAHCEGGYDDYD